MGALQTKLSQEPECLWIIWEKKEKKAPQGAPLSHLYTSTKNHSVRHTSKGENGTLTKPLSARSSHASGCQGNQSTSSASNRSAEESGIRYLE